MNLAEQIEQMITHGWGYDTDSDMRSYFLIPIGPHEGLIAYARMKHQLRRESGFKLDRIVRYAPFEHSCDGEETEFFNETTGRCVDAKLIGRPQIVVIDDKPEYRCGDDTKGIIEAMEQEVEAKINEWYLIGQKGYILGELNTVAQYAPNEQPSFVYVRMFPVQLCTWEEK